jgi:hypothetical protein
VRRSFAAGAQGLRRLQARHLHGDAEQPKEQSDTHSHEPSELLIELLIHPTSLSAFEDMASVRPPAG